MTTRGITCWAVLLIAAVAVALPVAVEVAPTMFGTRTLTVGSTAHCGSAVTAFYKESSGSGYGGVCHQAGKDRLVRVGLGTLVALFAWYAAWQVFGSDRSPSEPSPEATT